MDLAEIGDGFKQDIADYFKKFRPKVIVETGLYQGLGSTKLICELIRDIPILDAQFFSIECDVENVKNGFVNLTNHKLQKYVQIVNGLSIPRHLLPDEHDVRQSVAIAMLSRVKIDHRQDAAALYMKETEGFAVDDVLDDIISLFPDIDFLLLDSAGHIGKIEFDYAISKLKKPCAIALDDTCHIKHHLSLETIRKDPRFVILHESFEKNGHVIAKFTP